MLDAGVVVAFAVVGRQDHGYDSGLADYARVATPFLIGAAASGVALRGWEKLEPRTGAALALGTVAIGMLARRFIWGDGTALTFIIVATAFMLTGMVGWRFVAGLLRSGDHSVRT